MTTTTMLPTIFTTSSWYGNLSRFGLSGVPFPTVATMTTSDILWGCLFMYVAIEIAFYVLFHVYMVPRANVRLPAQAFRDYGNARHKLLLRVLDRIAMICAETGQNPQQAAQTFLHEWFRPIEPTMATTTTRCSSSKSKPSASLLRKDTSTSFATVPLTRDSSIASSAASSLASSENDPGDSDSVSSVEEDDVKPSSSNSSSTETDSSSTTTTRTTSTLPPMTIQDIGQDELEEFLAWALFEKHPHELVAWEHEELQVCYKVLQEQLNVVFTPGSLHRMRPRRLSLEDVNPLHRPLLMYFFFYVASQVLVGLVLRWSGFQKVVSRQTGLVGWYRPAQRNTPTTSTQQDQQQQRLPLLFFHGIAPGGLFFYLPMLLRGLLAQQQQEKDQDRSCFLFENPNIASCLRFHALTEEETCKGIAEVVDQFIPQHQAISVCGHSFGTVPMTWLIHSPLFRNRIQQLVLIDPVNIMLSEPDVMVNFLYNTGFNTIRLFAGSELFTTYYLRRHFAWYNGELWLDDIPDHVQTIVALSEKDVIVPAAKVKRYVELYHGLNNSKDTTNTNTMKKNAKNSNDDHANVNVLFWKGQGHGCSVYSPSKWSQLHQVMLQQEHNLVTVKASRYQQ